MLHAYVLKIIVAVLKISFIIVDTVIPRINKFPNILQNKTMLTAVQAIDEWMNDSLHLSIWCKFVLA